MSTPPTTGSSGGMIIPLRSNPIPEVIPDTRPGPKSPPGATAEAREGPFGIPEQLSLFGEEPGR
jgi:hypothetical protein